MATGTRVVSLDFVVLLPCLCCSFGSSTPLFSGILRWSGGVGCILAGRVLAVEDVVEAVDVRGLLVAGLGWLGAT